MPFVRSNGTGSYSSRPIYNVTTQQYENSASVISPSTTFPTIGNYWGDLGTNAGNSSLVAASRTAKGHTQSTNIAWFTNDINGGSGY